MVEILIYQDLRTIIKCEVCVIVKIERIDTVRITRITNDAELQTAFNIRITVFVEEQGVPFDVELDEHDAYADHVLVYFDDLPVATGRVRIVNDTAKLERICVMPSHRKYGIGKAVVQALEEIAKEKGLHKAKLHGQTQAMTFYEKLGYISASDEFMEEGIPHKLMIKDLILNCV